MNDAVRRPAPLGGLRILDLSRVVAGPFCTQVLGDLGAEVIRVQPPDDVPSPEPGPISHDEAMSWALNRNKRSVFCDLKTAEGLDLARRLAGTSDVVFDNFRPGVLARLGLDRDALVAVAGDQLITCSLTGFGSYGELTNVPAYDPIVQAMSGLMHLTRAREDGTPVKWGTPIGDLLAGLFGSIGILAAVTERSRSGRGQHVEVAMLDVMLALNTVRVPMALSFGQEPGPTPYEGGQGTVPYGLFRCADGWISIGIMDRAWSSACELIGRPDLADDPRFAALADRQRNLPALIAELQSTLATLPAATVEERFLTNGIPAGRVLSVSEAVNHPQVIARGMVVPLTDEHGRCAVVAGDPLGMADPAAWQPPRAFRGEVADLLDRVPDAGASSPRAGRVDGVRGAPLAGITLVEMDGDEPSKAFAAQILADLGARVIRVDRPPLQQTDPYPDETRAAAFRCALNRNKESVTVDLRSDGGREFVHALLRRADVLLDNYRPGVLGRLGLDDDTVRTLAPDIVACSITGFGHTGPWGSYPAFDAAIQALGGGQTLSVAHDDIDTPVRCGSPIGGLTGALYATVGILAALHGREVNGGGRRIDLSLLDAQVSLLSYRIPQAVSVGLTIEPQPRVGGTGSVPYGAFAAASGTWIVIAITDQFWIPFCEAVGRPEWIHDGRFADSAARRRNAEALHELLERLLAAAPAQHWQDCFARRPLPAAAVVTISEAFTSDHVLQRGMRVRLDDALHPEGVAVAGQPIKLSACGPQTYRPAPRSGADTDTVRAEFFRQAIAHE